MRSAHEVGGARTLLHSGPAMVVASVAGFAVSAALVKVATQGGVPVAAALGARYVFAFGAIGLLAQSGVLKLRLRRWGLLIARGAATALAIGLYYWAISRIPLAVATTLNYTFPTFAALYAWALLGERPSGRVIAALAAATLGVVIVVRPLAGGAFDTGALIALASGVAGGMSVALVGPLRRENSAWGVLFVTALVGTVGVSPFLGAAWHPLGPGQVALLAVIALATLVAQLLLLQGLKYLTAAQGGLLMMLTVPLTALLGLVWLGERPAGSLLLGGGLILLAEASLFLERRAPRPDPFLASGES